MRSDRGETEEEKAIGMQRGGQEEKDKGRKENWRLTLSEDRISYVIYCGCFLAILSNHQEFLLSLQSGINS